MSRLNFLSLTCEKKQDLVGKDEIELWVDDERHWGPHTFKKNQWHNMQPDGYEFDSSCEVQLREYDGDKHKAIGRKVTIRDSDPSQGTHEFKTSGAHYVFNYSISPA